MVKFSDLKKGDYIYFLYNLVEVSEWQLTSDFTKVSTGFTDVYSAQVYIKSSNITREIHIPVSDFESDYCSVHGCYSSLDKLSEVVNTNLKQLRAKSEAKIQELKSLLSKEESKLKVIAFWEESYASGKLL